MITNLNTTPQLIGLAAAGAASLGISLADGLLQPTARLLELARRSQSAPAPEAPAKAPASPSGFGSLR